MSLHEQVEELRQLLDRISEVVADQEVRMARMERENRRLRAEQGAAAR